MQYAVCRPLQHCAVKWRTFILLCLCADTQIEMRDKCADMLDLIWHYSRITNIYEQDVCMSADLVLGKYFMKCYLLNHIWHGLFQSCEPPGGAPLKFFEGSEASNLHNGRWVYKEPESKISKPPKKSSELEIAISAENRTKIERKFWSAIFKWPSKITQGR